MAGLLRQLLEWKEQIETSKPNTSASNLAAANASPRTAAKFLINNAFSFAEIDSICFELDVDTEQIAGETKDAKIESLIVYCEHRRRFTELLNLCAAKRPGHPWLAVIDLLARSGGEL